MSVLQTHTHKQIIIIIILLLLPVNFLPSKTELKRRERKLDSIREKQMKGER